MVASLIDRLYYENDISFDGLLSLMENLDEQSKKYLFEKAYLTRKKYYGDTVFLRGLIEISNYCRCDCLYCGIRRDNRDADRYRISPEDILNTCEKGYALGYRTFVLQGGEDIWFTDEILTSLLKSIKEICPGSAVTLSLGERTRESYQKLYDAGADRYLLRHETANPGIYQAMHPGMSFKNRVECLKNLKNIGFQAGSGFLIGLPGQSLEDIVRDLLLIKELKPQMAGIGPFIPQKNTPLKDQESGDGEIVLICLALLRLLIPEILLPATTALVTLDPAFRKRAFYAGANVVMPNLSPQEYRSKYALYDGKVFTGQESAQELENIKGYISDAGFSPIMNRGDNVLWKRK